MYWVLHCLGPEESNKEKKEVSGSEQQQKGTFENFVLFSFLPISWQQNREWHTITYIINQAWFYLFYVKIDVYANFQVTSESLRSIASLQKLEGLAMSGCSLVGDLGLHFLGNGCPSLLVISFLINKIVLFLYFLFIYWGPNIKSIQWFWWKCAFDLSFDKDQAG